jgi:hypothetical protein
MIPNQTPPSTPERHRTARRYDQHPQEMPTPQHRRLPAQPSNDDPFVADAPVAGGTLQAPLDLPLLDVAQLCAQADQLNQGLHRPTRRRGRGQSRGYGGGQPAVDTPVAGGTWQTPPNPPVLNVAQLRAQADQLNQVLHRPTRRWGHGHLAQPSVDLDSPELLSLTEIHSSRTQRPINSFTGLTAQQLQLTAQNISTSTPPSFGCPATTNPFANSPSAGLSAEQLLLARCSLPSSGATTPAASSSPSASHGPSWYPSCQHSHAPSPISSHQPSRAPSRAPSPVASSLPYDDDTQMSLYASPFSSHAPSPAPSEHNTDQPMEWEADAPVPPAPAPPVSSVPPVAPAPPVAPVPPVAPAPPAVLPLAMRPIIDDTLPIYDPINLKRMDVECLHCHTFHFDCEKLSTST